MCGTTADGGGAGGGGSAVTLERAGAANKEWRYVHQGSLQSHAAVYNTCQGGHMLLM